MRLQGFILKDKWDDAYEQLKRFVQDVRAVLDNGITLGDHLRGELVGPVRWNSKAPTVFATTRTTRPTAVVALSATKTGAIGNTVTSWSPVTWTWTTYTSSAPTVSVSAISGLAASTDYDVVFFVMGG